jgi:hypothetical protein
MPFFLESLAAGLNLSGRGGQNEDHPLTMHHPIAPQNRIHDRRNTIDI